MANEDRLKTPSTQEGERRVNDRWAEGNCEDLNKHEKLRSGPSGNLTIGSKVPVSKLGFDSRNPPSRGEAPALRWWGTGQATSQGLRLGRANQ